MGLSGLHDQSLVNVGDDTTTGNCGLDEGIELLVSADGKLEMAGSDAFNFEIFAGVTCKLKDLSGEVLEDGCGVDS